jgi:hypothetical protein
MTPLSRRSKMISFRLSPEEYRMLLSACGPNGARSISDLARKAMLELIVSNGNGHVLSDELHNLRNRVQQISQELERIAPLVDKPLGKTAAAGEVPVK